MPEQANYSSPLSILCMVIIALMLALPVIFNIFPPKKINAFYGYRTPFSMKNQDTWTEANTYFNKLYLKLAIGITIISAILFFLFKPLTLLMILSIFPILPILISAFATSKHLESIFNENGERL
jgi:uncharacterized membrane protein